MLGDFNEWMRGATTMPYDPEKDLVPVAHYITAPFILAVNPALPPRTVPEFITYAKEQPAPLNYSSPAGGGVAHFAVELMRHRFDLKLTHVPYKNSPQSIMDIAAGPRAFRLRRIRRVAAADSRRQAARAGGVVGAAPARQGRHPDVREASGVKDYEAVAWHILVISAKTPRPIVERLHAEMKKIMTAPDMRSVFPPWG